MTPNLRLLVQLAVVLALAGSGVAAQPARASVSPSPTLELRPAAGPHPPGEPFVVEALVRRPGGGASGVVVDFEVTEGPGDDDLGTGGNTPEEPDLSCTTAGDPTSATATCTVAYTERDNAGGVDAVLGWIDADGADATVEADRQEGADQLSPGSSGCRPGASGAGSTPEPDDSDCVEETWTARVADVVDLQPESDTATVGTSGSLEATVLDQFGDVFSGAGRSATVSVELLAGSVHDPGDGVDFGSPDLGSCDTGSTGRCTVSLASSAAGDDRLCAYLSGRSEACSEVPGAPELDNAADVVERRWEPAPVTPPAEQAPGEEAPASEPPSEGDAPPAEGTPVEPTAAEGLPAEPGAALLRPRPDRASASPREPKRESRAEARPDDHSRSEVAAPEAPSEAARPSLDPAPAGFEPEAPPAAGETRANLRTEEAADEIRADLGPEPAVGAPDPGPELLEAASGQPSEALKDRVPGTEPPPVGTVRIWISLSLILMVLAVVLIRRRRGTRAASV